MENIEVAIQLKVVQASVVFLTSRPKKKEVLICSFVFGKTSRNGFNCTNRCMSHFTVIVGRELIKKKVMRWDNTAVCWTETQLRNFYWNSSLRNSVGGAAETVQLSTCRVGGQKNSIFIPLFSASCWHRSFVSTCLSANHQRYCWWFVAWCDVFWMHLSGKEVLTGSRFQSGSMAD